MEKRSNLIYICFNAHLFWSVCVHVHMCVCVCVLGWGTWGRKLHCVYAVQWTPLGSSALPYSTALYIESMGWESDTVATTCLTTIFAQSHAQVFLTHPHWSVKRVLTFLVEMSGLTPGPNWACGPQHEIWYIVGSRFNAKIYITTRTKSLPSAPLKFGVLHYSSERKLHLGKKGE